MMFVHDSRREARSRDGELVLPGDQDVPNSTARSPCAAGLREIAAATGAGPAVPVG
jgi:hypothetical protein